MEKLTKEAYQILHSITRGRNTFERLEDLFNKQTISKVIDQLEKSGLIVANYREGKIYSFMESPIGEAILESKEYEEWFAECGD